MTSRRLETNFSNQPVSFYKYVALGFFLITVALLAVVLFMSAKKATITITTKQTPVNITFSVGVGEDGGTTKVTGFVTTTAVTLSQVFSPTGSREEVGVAKGTMVIHNESDTEQALVATTRFLSADKVLFRLKNSVRVPAKGLLEAEVYADQPGASGNIGPTKFTIPGLGEARQKVVYGESVKVMVGGVKVIGILQDADVKKAEKKLVDDVKAEAAKILADQVGDNTAIFQVVDYTTKTQGEVGKEMAEFTVEIQAKVAGVFYSASDLKNLATNELMKRAVGDVNKVEPGIEEPTVTVEAIDPNGNNATLTVYYDGLTSLNSESKQLEKLMFFGKTKDELRRYVLSLDGVYSVDVDFSPAWMRTVPHVADHVNVVIKNIR